MRTSAALGGLLLGFILILAAGVHLLGYPGSAARQLQALVKERTGRTLTVAGTPRLVLFPQLAVALPGVAVRGADGSGPLFTADELRLGIGGRSLLARSLAIDAVTLVGPKLELMVDDKGRPNWAGEIAELPPLLIENGAIAYLDRRTGAAARAEKITARLVMTAPRGEVEARGSLFWNRQHIAFESWLKSPERLAQDGSPVTFSLSGASTQLGFDGRLSLLPTFSLAGRLAAEAADLRALAGWAGLAIAEGRGLKDARLAGAFEASPGGMRLTKATLAFDGQRGEGEVKLEASRPLPKLSAEVAFPRLNLDPYIASGRRAGSAEWSGEPFDLRALSGLAAAIAVKAQSVEFGGVVMGPAIIEADLHGGALDLKVRDLALLNGRAAAQIILDGARRPPSLRLAVTAERLRTAALSQAGAPFDGLDGEADVVVSLAATGGSAQEMVSTAKGAGRVSVRAGTLRALNLETLLRQVGTRVLEGWQAGAGGTPFDELSASFALADGIAASPDLKLKGPGVSMTGTGEVDVLRQAIDVRLEPEGLSLPVPVIVRGPWAAPRIYPDMAGILDDPEAAYKALRKLARPAAAAQ